MYLFLGEDTLVNTRDIVGIFDLDTSTVEQDTRDYLAAAQRAGRVVNVGSELPKSFVVTSNIDEQVYISQLNAPTLRGRLKNSF